MKQNKHTVAIPDSVIADVRNHLTAAMQAVLPYIIALTPHEKQTLLKIGEKNISFVEKAHEHAVNNPTLVPSYIDMAAFEVDFKDARGLMGLLTLAQQLATVLDDTITAAGSDAFHSSLAFYHFVQAAAKDDVPGAKTILEDLKVRFPGGKRRGKNPENDAFPPEIKID